MPTYEYHCPKCNAKYELRQGFSADTTHTCEECGKGIAKRVLHAPRVHFKGSGFYATDSRSKSSAMSEPSPAASSGSDDSSSSSTDTTSTVASEAAGS